MLAELGAKGIGTKLVSPTSLQAIHVYETGSPESQSPKSRWMADRQDSLGVFCPCCRC